MDAQNGSVDELLRYMRVADEEELDTLEREFAGAFKIGPSGRYGCRLLARGEVFEFKLGRLPDGTENFFVTKDGIAFDQEEEQYSRRFYQLVRHRAAEYIGGIRAGHSEYNTRYNKPRRKKL